MNASCVALAALGGLQSCGASHCQKLGAYTLLLKHAQQVVESNAVASHHHQIGEMQIPPEKLHLNDRAGFDDLLVAVNRCKTVGSAESSYAAGSLSHRECRKGGRHSVIRRLDQSNQQIFRPADLAIHSYR